MNVAPPDRNSWHTGLSLVGCFVLTAVVVHTCVRIEYLNARGGYLLPVITSGEGNPKWRVAAQRPLRDALERAIALERSAAFTAAEAKRPVPDIEEFTGPPYSDDEQAAINAALAQNAFRIQLHSWVGGMGMLQYLLAPAAFSWAVVLHRRTRSFPARCASASFALSAVVAIGLATYRGYFTSLGW